MPCAFCNKFINKGEEFVLVGKYPGYWNLFTTWLWDQTSFFSPEQFGRVYHKSCFIKDVEQRETRRREKRKSNGNQTRN